MKTLVVLLTNIALVVIEATSTSSSAMTASGSTQSTQTISTTSQSSIQTPSTTPPSSSPSTMSTTQVTSMSKSSKMTINVTSSATTTMAANVTTSTITPLPETAILCLDGMCYGNISCLLELENMTCRMKEDQSCFLQVYTNFTDTFYTAGCRTDCEESSQDAGTGNNTVVSDVYCCADESRCNGEIREIQSSASRIQNFGGTFLLWVFLYLIVT